MAKNTPEDFFGKTRRKQSLRKANKTQKRNRDTRPPRRRDWLDVGDTLDDERIMPVDENDRRRAVEEHIQQPSDDAPTAGPETAADGQVIEVSSGLCRVRMGDDVRLCSLRGSLTAHDSSYTNVVAVGDYVTVTAGEPGHGVVESVLPRRNEIARPDPGAGHLRQVLVSNVDQVLIVASWRQPAIWTELIDRYLITAERYAITPLIAVNKIDLAADQAEVEAALKPYHDLDYTVLLTSAETGQGVDALCDRMMGKITVLAGLSGVGKSSLLTATLPGFTLRTGEVNEDRGQGRHTTTQATMLSFGDGGYVIDTPGIREFGLYGLTRAELDAFYADIAIHAAQCKFADCTHDHEPDCAVRDAIERGALSEQRLHNYRAIAAGL